jgi:excisionase family DNA binding protein
VSSAPDADPFVQIRLSDLVALRVAAANQTAPAPSAPPMAPPSTPTTPEYLTTKEAAALLGVTAKGLEAMRARGEGPAFIRVGRRVRYVASALGRGPG